MAWISVLYRPRMIKVLVLAMWGARYLKTSGSCGETNRSTLTSIGADFDRSRYVSVRSTSWYGPLNRKQFQRDGLYVRVERQYRQTCVAATKSRSLVRCSRTFDKTSGGSLLTGINVFIIALVVRRTS